MEEDKHCQNNTMPSEVKGDRFNLSRKIFVGNISYRVTQKRLTKFFSKFGKVDYCYMVKDHIRKRPKGIAFITFSSGSDVSLALDATDEQLTLDGRIMRVSCAEESTRVKHTEGTLWDNHTENSLANEVENLHIDNSVDSNNASVCAGECHINKLCDDTMILIMSMLPWRHRMCLERVCKRWNILAKQAWHRQDSIHFQSMFKRFEGLTDTKLCSVLVRGGIYLRKLDISASPRLLTDMSMDVIAEQCPNLACVDLSGMAVTDISLRTLGKKCTKLKSVCLQRCFHVSEKGLQWLFENCQNIENINIQGNGNITGNSFQKIGPNCKIMNLTDCSKLTDTGVMKICRHCKLLQELSISNCQLLSDRSLDGITQNLKNLVTVYMEKTFSHFTIEGMLKLSRLTKLKSIYFAQNLCVNDIVITALAMHCPFLETLDISGCYRNVTGEGIKALAFCSNLTSLDISYLYKVDDESIQVLSRIGRLKSLTARACSWLTDDAFSDLACLCPYLELLDVSGCLNVTKLTVKYFLESANQNKDMKLTLCVGGSSVVEEDLDFTHPCITFCVHDLSHDYLRGDRGVIIPEQELETDSDDEDDDESLSQHQPVVISAVAAGAEIDDEMDNGWEENDFIYYDDDLLVGDDPLEMERFQFS